MDDEQVEPSEWDREFAVMVEKFYADFGPEIAAITGMADALMEGGSLEIVEPPPEGAER